MNAGSLEAEFCPLSFVIIRPDSPLGIFNHRHCYFLSRCSEWLERAPPENILRVLIVMRMLMRDPAFQKRFVVELKAVKKLCSALEQATKNYLVYGETLFIDKILIEMTSE